jgi:transposase InsO family protein
VPWKVTDPMSERMKFALRIEAGERMTDVCRDFGISRKTGYKLWERYQAEGAKGLFDRPRAPLRVANRTSVEIRGLLVEARRAHPTWGPRKLRAWIEGHHPGVKLPAASTIGDLLMREGLIVRRRRRSLTPRHPLPLTVPEAPNDVWCADFKGQFRLGDGTYCYPLTISDRYSRFLLSCEGLESVGGESPELVFDAAFRRYGLPSVIRTDNGVPFASTGLMGLSRLSVRWLRLGIRPERIKPAHPQQNGQHERMHRVLKAETTRPSAMTLLQQQERFDHFVEEYNHERPHEALGQVPPGSLYGASERAMPDPVSDPEYPLHDERRRVNSSGHVSLGRRNQSYFLGIALAGEMVGLREVGANEWLVSFMAIDLGTIDQRLHRFTPAEHSPIPEVANDELPGETAAATDEEGEAA